MLSLDTLFPRIKGQFLPILGLIVALVPVIGLLVNGTLGGTEEQPTIEGPKFEARVVNSIGMPQMCSYDADWVPEERVHRTDADGRIVTEAIPGEHSITVHCGTKTETFTVNVPVEGIKVTLTVGPEALSSKYSAPNPLGSETTLPPDETSR